MYWIVLANSNQFRIYNYQRKDRQLSLLKEMHHEESKMRDTELTTDKPGRFVASNAAHGAYSPRTDPKENEIDHFLATLAEELESGRTNNHYEKLVIIAPPHVYGKLLTHTNKNVERMIIGNLTKDYINLSTKELSDFLHHSWQEIVTS